MSYAVKSLFLLAFCGFGIAASLHAEDAPPKEGKIIILDGKRVRVDDKMNVLEHLDKPEAKKEEAKPAPKTAESEKAAKKAQEKADKEAAEKKKQEEKAAADKKKADDKAAEEKKKEEEKAAKKPAEKKTSEAPKEETKKEEPAKEVKTEVVVAPAAAPVAPVVVKSPEETLRAERELAREMIVQDGKLRASVRKLATPGWRDARVELINAGKSSVPYLIEAIGGGDDATNPVPAYSLAGHTKFDTGRASRQRTLAEVATEVLTQLVKTHSDYKGDVPTMDQRAWQTWWTANGASVTFGKTAGLD